MAALEELIAQMDEDIATSHLPDEPEPEAAPEAEVPPEVAEELSDADAQLVASNLESILS